MITAAFDTCFAAWESLVEGCVILDDRIVDPAGRAVPDAPYTALNLGVRAYNVLTRSQADLRAPSHDTLMISDILRHEPWKLFRLRNLGLKSANEIVDEIRNYLETARVCQGCGDASAVTVTTRRLKGFLSEHEFDGVTMEQMLAAFPGADEKQTGEVVGQLVAEGSVVRDGDRIVKAHRSFFGYAFTSAKDEKQKLNDRHLEVLRWRKMGYSLEDIGRMKGMSRERIRQIEQKAFSILTGGTKELFAEDAWKYLYTTYALPKDTFLTGLNQPLQTWYYLSCRYQPGMLNLRLATADEAVPADVRGLLQDWIHRSEIEIGGRWISRSRQGIEDYLLETCCRDEISVDDFLCLYERFTAEHGLDRDADLKLTDSVRQTRINRLTASGRVLWKQGRKLRYYDIASGDFTELLETLDLSRFHDTEISTLKLFGDYPETMRQYDIRDEYELHNLLKKLQVEKQIPGMKFGRMPGLQFGSFNRDEAVREIMFALAPVSIDDLTEMIRLEYGFAPETVKANWLKGIADYYHQGMYSVAYEQMPEDQTEAMRAALTDDFYNFSELRELYLRTVDQPDLSLLSSFNLKRLGLQVNTSYVIRNWPSAEAYFDHILMDSDRVDLTETHKRYEGIRSFIGCLAAHRENLDLIEYEPWKFINVRALERNGFSRERLGACGGRVLDFTGSGRGVIAGSDGNVYFSVSSLRKAGFTDELDALGFGDMFRASLLKADKRFSSQRIGGAAVFSLSRKFFDTRDFLRACVEQKGSVGAKDLQLQLSSVWGIALTREKLLEKARCGETCWNPVTDRLYADENRMAADSASDLTRSA